MCGARFQTVKHSNPALMLKAVPSAPFTPQWNGQVWLYFQVILAVASTISKSSQFIQLLKQGRGSLENHFTTLDYRGHSLISSLLLLSKSEILSPFFIWIRTSFLSKVILKKRMNYRSQPVYVALFYFTSINSSSERVLVQEAVLHVYRSIHSEGHKLRILLAMKAKLVAINCFS